MTVHVQGQESFSKATRTGQRAQKGKVESNEVNLLLQLCWVCRSFLHRNASDTIAMEGLRGLKKRGQAGRSVTEFCALFLMGKISILWIC